MPTTKPDLGELSVTQLVELTSRHPRTVAKRLAQAGVEPVRRDGKTLYYSPRPALQAIYLGTGLDPTAEKARLDAARASLAEQEHAKRAGALVDSLDVQALGASFASGVSQRVLGLRVLAPLIRAAESDEEGASILEDGAREALSEIARMGDLVGELSRRARRGAPGVDVGDAPAAEADGEPVGGRGAETLA